MPRPSNPASALPKTMGWIGTLEEIEDLQSKYGPEVIESGIGGPDRPWFPWQIRVLTCTADEIGCFGGKGSGKSELMRAWLISGNPTLPDNNEDGSPNYTNRSYTYCPDYVGLILRRNQKDLEDFLIRAQRMWSPYGAEYKNGYFRFPTPDGKPGARIDVGHLSDANAWQKYIGTEYQRIAIDEAGLIPEYSLYDELKSCMRAPNPELRLQTMLASNAGGPGTGWIMEYFMKARDENGLLIPHDTFILDKRIHPKTKKEVVKSRVWIFSNWEDNPILSETNYAVGLDSMMDPKKRAAYLEGHWDALFGSYFGDIFRPDGPVAANNEPPNACHVITKSKVDSKYPVEIRPWWPMSIGGDWGYAHDAAFLWARKDPRGRVIITEEMSVDHTLPERLGVEIARRTRTHLELLPSHSITLWLGHDAFAMKTGDRTIAELIALGIAKILGPNAVFLPDIIINQLKRAWDLDAFNWETQQQRDKTIEQIRLQRKTGITIKVAERTGIISWQHCREALRWEHTIASNVSYDHTIAMRLLQENPKAFNEYCRLYRNIEPETLPKLQILDCCPGLIASIPRAQHEDGTENVERAHYKGRDLLDAWLYLMLGIEDENPQEPFEVYRDRQLTHIVQQVPGMTVNDLTRANIALEAEWKEKEKPLAPYTPPRGARSRRLMMKSRMMIGENNGR